MLNRGLVLLFHAFRLFRLTQTVSYDIFLVNSSVFLFIFYDQNFILYYTKENARSICMIAVVQGQNEPVIRASQLELNDHRER